MTYRELLDLYKRNELDTDQKNQVETDIEKQEAISDYLYEKDNIPALKEVFDEQRFTGEADLVSTEQEHKFMKIVKQSIRRAFMKMGIIASAIALIILLFIQIILPDIISYFYYNPGKLVAENTNQMSLDMAVYTELLIPQYFRYNITVDDLGYGDYEFCINQNYSYSGVFTNVPGRIERGRMIMYETRALTRPTGNAFASSVGYEDPSLSMSELEAAGQISICAAGASSENLSQLNALSDNNYYVAYVTLQQVMEYPPFIRFLQDNSIADAWCAVCTNGDPAALPTVHCPQNIGFRYSPINSDINWDKELYPDLMLTDPDLMSSDPDYYDEYNKNLADAAFMQTHFISMLRYMSEQKKFLKMIDFPDIFTEAVSFVEKNGLLIYGFAITADKEQLLKLSGQDEVYIIYTQPLR